MASNSRRSWWGEKFLQALEAFTDRGRLGRGRSYANNGRIKSWSIEGGGVKAKVRGSINAYFGVHKEPTYSTSVALNTIPPAQWQALIQTLGNRAGMITRLLLNEMPEAIDTVFETAGQHLLPANSGDFKTHCSCPDYANPCKHVAGLCYVLAEQLDRDPILLFELRGLPRAELRAGLLKTPLGQALASSLEDAETLQPVPVESYFSRPQRLAISQIQHGDFWGEQAKLPAEPPAAVPPGLPAVLIRKAGDYPPFWDEDQSFVEIMAEFYERVRKANKDI